MKTRIKILLFLLLLTSLAAQAQVRLTANAPQTVAVGDAFVQIVPAQKSAYIGEGMVVTVKLYTQHTITGFGKISYPTFDGFAVETIEVPTQNMTQEVYKGEKYYTAVLAQYLLFPKKVGTNEITSGSYEIAVSKKQKGVKSDDFFGRETHTIDTLRVGNLPVSITALPYPNKNAGNSAPVTGNFRLEALVDEMNIIEGDSVCLTVRFSGVGNAKLIATPDVPPADFAH